MRTDVKVVYHVWGTPEEIDDVLPTVNLRDTPLRTSHFLQLVARGFHRAGLRASALYPGSTWDHHPNSIDAITQALELSNWAWYGGCASLLSDKQKRALKITEEIARVRADVVFVHEEQGEYNGD